MCWCLGVPCINEIYHIEKCPPTLHVLCFTLQTTIKHKCVARIINRITSIGVHAPAFTWILWLWFQFHWVNKGSGYHEMHVLCIVAHHVLWVVQNFYSFLNLELQWSLSLVGSFCNFYIGRKYNQKWYQNLLKRIWSVKLTMMLCVFVLRLEIATILSIRLCKDWINELS
jgi:hypothetical protein